MRMGKKIMSVAVAMSVEKNYPANTTVMIVPQTPLKSSWDYQNLEDFSRHDLEVWLVL